MSKWTHNKYRILTTLQNAELCVEDLEVYSNLKHLDLVPVFTALRHWGDIKAIGEEINARTNRKRKIFTITEKGERKLRYLRERYGFNWKPKTY
jgi:hypothetical protein